MTLIPCRQLILKNLEKKDRFEFLRHSLADVGELIAPRDQRNCLDACITAYKVNNISIGRTYIGKHVFERTINHTNQNTSNFLRLRYIMSGAAKGVIAGQPVKMSPGYIYLTNLSDTYNIASSQSDYITAFLPHCSVNYDPNRHKRHYEISTSSTRGQILKSFLFDFLKSLKRANASEAKNLSNGFAGLIRGLILGNLALEHDFQTAPIQHRKEHVLTYAMRLFIEKHLTDPFFTLEQLYLEFGISRATAYRYFTEFSGVNSYICNRRLECAFTQLQHAARVKGNVQKIAHTFCFFNAQQFNKVFKNRFGYSPSEILGSKNMTNNCNTAEPYALTPNILKLSWLDAISNEARH